MGNVSVLGDDDVVEVTWDLHAALLAVGTVSYAERLLHAGLQSPGVERVLTTTMAELATGRGRGRCRGGCASFNGVGHTCICITFGGILYHCFLNARGCLDVGVEEHGGRVGRVRQVRQVWPLQVGHDGRAR